MQHAARAERPPGPVAPTDPRTEPIVSDRRRNIPMRRVEELFERQRTSREQLPDPRLLAVNLTRYLVEILAGVRDPEQIARWVEADAYAGIVQLVAVRTRARRARRQAPAWPRFRLGPTRFDAPADGVVECVTVVHQEPRTYPIAMRLVGLDGRWHAVVVDVG